MHVLITGAAGFIGSHLAEEMLDLGHRVSALDTFTSAYPSRLKHQNLDSLHGREGFDFHEVDVRRADLEPLIEPVDTVFHLAAIPGVRDSWRSGFRSYVEHNIHATQRLLEATHRAGNPRFVYASSSSIYGDAAHYPVKEDAPKRPFSPYGVSKLAAEQLCATYAEVFDVDAVSLRFFSVYGPRQRPDMGVHRIIEAALNREVFSVFGDGSQVRDMTYVKDVVSAAIRAAEAETVPGSAFNVSGGSQISLLDLIGLVEEVSGQSVEVEMTAPRAGDVRRTGGDTRAAEVALGWKPVHGLPDGIAAQLEWHRWAKPGRWAG